MSALVFIGLWWTGYEAIKGRFGAAPSERLLFSGLAVFLEILFVTQLAGLFHALSPVTVRIAGTALLATHAFFARQQILGAVRPPPSRFPERSWPKWLWPCLAIVPVIYLWRLWLAWKLPPNWDGLSCHMPMILRWIQQKEFSLAGSGVNLQSYYPRNGELIGLWLCLIDGGSVETAKIAQAAGLPLIAVSGYLLGEQVSGERWAGAVSLAFLAVPMVMVHSGEAYVDLFYAAFWLASLAGLMGYWRTSALTSFYAGGAGLGLALGTKGSIYFLLPLVLTAVCAVAFGKGRRLPGSSLVLAALVILATGGISYLRNWSTMGNPVYPFEARMGAWVLFHGISAEKHLNSLHFESWFVPSLKDWLWYPLKESVEGRVLYSTENGFGALFAAGWFAFPFIAYKAWRDRSAAMLSLNFSFLLTLWLFIRIQPVREPRYIIFLCAFPILGLVYLFRDLSGRLQHVAMAVWSFAILFNVCGVAGSLLKSPAVLQAWRQLRRNDSYDLGAYLHQRYGAMGDAWTAINKVITAKDVVATNSTDLLLPWAGTPARATVYVVFPYVPEETAYLGAETPEPWLHLLRRLNATYLVLCNLAWDQGSTTKDEEDAIAAYPRDFFLLGSWQDSRFGNVKVFRLHPAA